jgi:hypothetical protein
MKLFQAAGLFHPNIKLDDDARDILVREATQFLKAGSLTLDDWKELTQEERAAFAAAGETLDTKRAYLAGMAAQGMSGAVQILSLLDGGAAKRQLLCEIYADKISSKMAGKKIVAGQIV